MNEIIGIPHKLSPAFGRKNSWDYSNIHPDATYHEDMYRRHIDKFVNTWNSISCLLLFHSNIITGRAAIHWGRTNSTDCILQLGRGTTGMTMYYP